MRKAADTAEQEIDREDRRRCFMRRPRRSITSTIGFLPVHRVAQRRTASRTASRTLSSSAPASIGARGGVGGVGEEVVAVLLDRHAERADQRIAGKLAVRRRPASATVISPLSAILRRSLIVEPSAGRMTSPSSTSRPTRSSPIFFGPLGREADDVAILLDDRLRDALRQAEARLLAHVARSRRGPGRGSAGRIQPYICGQLGPARDGPRHGHAPGAR